MEILQNYRSNNKCDDLQCRLINFPVPMRDEQFIQDSSTICRFQAGNSSSQVTFDVLSIFITVSETCFYLWIKRSRLGSMTTGQSLNGTFLWL